MLIFRGVGRGANQGVRRRAGRGAGRGGRRRGGGVGLAELVAEPGWQKMADVDPPVVQPLREATGPTEPLPHDARPVDFLHQMVGADFFEKLAVATNANAASKRPPAQPSDDPNATSDPHWRATTADEMRAFVGINIAMGLKDLPEYWSEEPVLPPFPLANSALAPAKPKSWLCHCANVCYAL